MYKPRHTSLIDNTLESLLLDNDSFLDFFLNQFSKFHKTLANLRHLNRFQQDVQSVPLYDLHLFSFRLTGYINNRIHDEVDS